ncbi:terminase small subunit [Caudoviricetes sp.]|nr:terminase small subunit [Caudoviricetes sp.]
MALTPQREQFCRLIAIDGKNQSDAYRGAFDSSKMTPGSVNTKASEMAKDVEVRLRIDELKRELLSFSTWTRQNSIDALREVINNPDKASDITGAVKELNIMHGYNAPVEVKGNFTHEHSFDIVKTKEMLEEIGINVAKIFDE